MPDLQDLCTAAVAAARDGEAVEAYAQETRRTQIRVRDRQVESLTSSETRGLGVRLIVDHRMGYAYAADPDPGSIPDLVESARESAGFAEPDEANMLPELHPVDPIPGMVREDQLSLDPDRKITVALDLERLAVSVDPEVQRVESAGYGDAVSRVALASTRGGPISYMRTDAWAFASTLADRDGETQTGFAYRLSRGLDVLAWEEAGEEAARRAARLLGAVKPSTERLPVVLDPIAATAFIGVLSAALSAESVLKGRSPLAGMVGTGIGSSQVTLVDDGLLPDGPALAPFDDEGVRSAQTSLIEEGTLRGFLHNTYTSIRSNTTSTGNAGRASYRGVPGVSPSNLFLAPGDVDPEELLRSAGRAVYVQELSGLHSGANPVSGQFSVGATGLRVEDGALAAPLREMTIASTLLDVLRGVTALGSDLRFPGGGLGAPTVLIGEMTVGGR
jgi:PmbA protein